MWTYLWQNFLTDSKIRNWIADKTRELFMKTQASSLIEIWPWKWSITKLIKDITSHFCVIEKDKTLISTLETILPSEQIIIWDVLIHSFSALHQAFIVGNLPYYITSPILSKVVQNEVLGWLFMIQHEVWEKIKSDAIKKSYLYWLLNYSYEVKYLKTVPPKAFNPPPKVKSCLISLIKKTKKPDFDYVQMTKFLDLYAPFARKTLSSSTKIIAKTQPSIYFFIPSSLHKKRLEELSRDDLSIILQS